MQKRIVDRAAVRRLTIAVPVYNERERVGRAVKELLSVPFPVEVEVIVVDDGSADGTWDEIRSLSLPEHVRLVRHPRNRGKGAAVRTALTLATGDVFVPFDADLEYEPADLARLLQPIVDGKTDVVYGTRAFSSHASFSFWYVLGNRFLCLWANALFNCYISDLETCFKMARTDALRSLELRADSFDIEAEVTAKLLRAGHRPYELPVEYTARSRDEGKKIRAWDGVVALWTVLRIRLGGR